MKVILASKSPRRVEYLKYIVPDFEAEPSDYEEDNSCHMAPEELVQMLARGKAADVAKKHSGDDCLIISGDTVVSIDGQILNKPKDENDARNMIRMLQGNTHQVCTGVCIIRQNEGISEEKVFFERTNVVISKMSEEEIEEYIASNEMRPSGQVMHPWEDKAGAYGIQDSFGMKYISGIEGDFYNVVGIPLARIYAEIKKYF